MLEQQIKVSVVVIGRNEGARLSRCMQSVNLAIAGMAAEVIYVDSASADDSVSIAESMGARVLHAKSKRPTAALGRNIGWRAARGEFVLFLDGDTVLDNNFLSHAFTAMQNEAIAVVWGHRREMNPQQSVYVRVLDLDWIYPAGLSDFCGGDALMRRKCLEQVGGFDEAVIAGEEPELCRRLRHSGGKILHIDVPMTGHDLAIKDFHAYWKRAFRAGYAYAELAQRFRATTDPLWLRDARRNLLHGLVLLMLPLSLFFIHQVTVVLLFLGVMVTILLARSMARTRWKSSDSWIRFQYAIHSHFQQIPILCGQLAHFFDRHRGLQRGLIEYHR